MVLEIINLFNFLTLVRPEHLKLLLLLLEEVVEWGWGWCSTWWWGGGGGVRWVCRGLRVVIGGAVVHCWKQKLSCVVYLFNPRVGDAMNGGDEEIR